VQMSGRQLILKMISEDQTVDRINILGETISTTSFLVIFFCLFFQLADRVWISYSEICDICRYHTFVCTCLFAFFGDISISLVSPPRVSVNGIHNTVPH
jgi:hypothetical protein